jgi:hypothetical protein
MAAPKTFAKRRKTNNQQQRKNMSNDSQQQDNPYIIGKTYLIRTVTMIDTGVVVRVTPQEIVLQDAAWIADTGRFSQALKTCDFSEVEPFPDGEVIINRSAVIDAVQITKSPRTMK